MGSGSCDSILWTDCCLSLIHLLHMEGNLSITKDGT